MEYLSAYGSKHNRFTASENARLFISKKYGKIVGDCEAICNPKRSEDEPKGSQLKKLSLRSI